MLGDNPEKILNLYETKEGFYRVLPPPEKELEEYYSEKYYKEDCANYKHEYTDERKEHFLDTVRKVIKILRMLAFGEPKACLEIGCGEGWGLRIFKEEGWDVTGVDFTSYPCSIHNPDFVDDIITGSLYDTLPGLIKLGNKYQILYFDNLLEHVRDPVQLLEYCRELIEPDGALIIEVPNANSAFYRYLFNCGKQDWRMGFAKYPDHLAYFDIDSLRTVCNNAGFQEVIIMDIANYNYNINGVTFQLEEYLEAQPIKKALTYYAARADVGLGPEILGFWRPKDAVQGKEEKEKKEIGEGCGIKD